MIFTQRFSAPPRGNLLWVRRSSGGYNRIEQTGNGSSGGWTLPNCTGYAYGRFMECQGITTCDLIHSPGADARNWYGHSDRYSRGSTPYLGAVICWGAGRYGHVAIVEQIISNTDIIWSESNWSGRLSGSHPERYWRRIRGNPANYISGFQGYIYPPVTWDGEDPTPAPDDPSGPDDPDVSGRFFTWMMFKHRKTNKGGKFYT